MRAEYLYLAIMVFCSITFILIICMLIIILRKKNTLKKRNFISGQLEEWIMDIILENNTDANHEFIVPDNIKLILKKKIAQKVLLRELMKLTKSLSGISGLNLVNLYNQLKLYELSLERLASKLWHIKAKGIQELAVMNQRGHLATILNLTNHPDLMVRMEAQTAMVRLQGYEGLHFFDTLSYPLSEWHQVNLLALLSHQSLNAENGIMNWLNSSNPFVVQFSLKLIAEQHATEFYDEIIKCLSHPSDTVRRQAVLCLGQIPSNEAAINLNKQFLAETDKNIRLCIINEFIRTGSQSDLSFLQTLQQVIDVDIKLAANKTVLYLQKNL